MGQHGEYGDVVSGFALLRGVAGIAIMLAAPILALVAYEHVGRWPNAAAEWAAILATPLPGLVGLAMLPIS